MTKTGNKILAGVGLAIFQLLTTSACPDCNIFNNLSPSVRSSANIVVGTAESAVDDYTTLVRVERVLRGTNMTGSVAAFSTFGMKDSIGERSIFSDPAAEPPTFAVLPVELEWEVTYLIRGAPFSTNIWEYNQNLYLDTIPVRLRPKPRHAIEAIRAIEGASNVTRESGVEYAKRNRKELYPRIKKRLECRAMEFNLPATNRIIAHGVDGLVEAMWLLDADAAKKYFTEDFVRRFDRNAAVISTNVPSSGTLETRFVSSVLRHAKNAGSGETFRGQLLKEFPTLRGEALATALYALDYSELATPAALEAAAQQLLAQNPDQQLAVAAGFYQAAVEHGNWWAFDKARTELHLARSHCTGPDSAPLAAQIDEEAKHHDRFRGK